MPLLKINKDYTYCGFTTRLDGKHLATFFPYMRKKLKKGAAAVVEGRGARCVRRQGAVQRARATRKCAIFNVFPTLLIHRSGHPTY